MESATGTVAPPGIEPGVGGAPAGKQGSAWSLRLRVASGVLFVPLLVLLARAGGMAFLAFVMLQVFLGVTEFYGMMRAKGLMPQRSVGIASALLLLVSTYRPDIIPRDLLVTFALLALLGFGLSRPQARGAESLAATAFGVLYVGWLSAHLVMLRELPWQAGTEYAQGASFVLLAFFLTWSCDTGAYGFGRAFGRRRLWAEISPRKTVEGSIGGFACSIAAAWIARAWFAPYLRPWDAWLLGLLVGVFAQVGDLVESLLKRDAQASDSSDIIPGHGGVLDRFDSLYFGAPIVFYYLKYVIFQAP
jgi:phosphatidate cytidylyltransferase